MAQQAFAQRVAVHRVHHAVRGQHDHVAGLEPHPPVGGLHPLQNAQRQPPAVHLDHLVSPENQRPAGRQLGELGASCEQIHHAEIHRGEHVRLRPRQHQLVHRLQRQRPRHVRRQKAAQQPQRLSALPRRGLAAAHAVGQHQHQPVAVQRAHDVAVARGHVRLQRAAGRPRRRAQPRQPHKLHLRAAGLAVRGVGPAEHAAQLRRGLGGGLGRPQLVLLQRRHNLHPPRAAQRHHVRHLQSRPVQRRARPGRLPPAHAHGPRLHVGHAPQQQLRLGKLGRDELAHRAALQLRAPLL